MMKFYIGTKSNGHAFFGDRGQTDQRAQNQRRVSRRHDAVTVRVAVHRHIDLDVRTVADTDQIQG